MTPASLSNAVKQAARDLGFDAVGVSVLTPRGASPQAALSDPRPILRERLTDWLRRGFHATMAWMARDPGRRTDPSTVLPGCRSLISVGLNYYTGHRADERPGNGRIARYAWGDDYHRVLGERLTRLSEHLIALAPGSTARTYVDTGPIMEKAWAQQAGLGWIGKHSNLVSAQYGSWLVLGEILTTAELEPDEPAADLCGTCSLCVQACPTGAIAEPYVVDAGRCISYLTIEHRGSGAEVPEDVRRAIGNRIFGCDDCLDACPYNHYAEITHECGFRPTPLTLAPSLEHLMELDERQFGETFRASPIRRAKHAGLQRNVAWARANSSTDHARLRLSPTGAPSHD